MACVVLVLIDTLPFEDEHDKDGGLKVCGSKTGPDFECYYKTHNALINIFAKMNTATVGFIT